jgi:CheY-like chemotaxis protein
MPEVDGWQVLQSLKNDPVTREIPIIICSILEDEEKGFNLGAADYLVKPFIQDDLINAIARINHSGKIHNIMVIDDDLDDLRLVQKMLEDSGKFNVTPFDNGQKAWDAIHASRPDAVILDLFMPDMDGFTLLGNLRAEPEYADLPVMILTGADLTPEQHLLMTNLGQQMLTKGLLREKELLSTLEKALRQIRN